MDKEKNVPVSLEKSKDIKDHEDAVLKISAQYFADVLLPRFGIEGKVVSFGPTELVHLELKKLFQDFNFIMEDGRWIHFEFQSTNEGLDGLKRFRVYEAMTSYQYKVEVITYVLFSGKIKNPMTEFTEGRNTYRIRPIIMQHENADKVIANLQDKIQKGEILTREDLVSLILVPLMDGESSQKERIKSAYEITRKATMVDREEIRKIETVIYAMADKFLDAVDLESMKEEVKMTRLGQMLYNDGIAEGIEKGIEQGTMREMLRGIQVLVKTCKEFGAAKEVAVDKVMANFPITKQDAEENVEKYWKE